MAPRILVADRNYIGHDISYDSLARHGELTIRDFSPDDELTGILRREKPVAVLANRCRFTRPVLEAAATAPSPLRLICLTATGTNTVDLEAAADLGIAVCNVVGYSTDSVAQHTFALVLELLNRPADLDRQARGWLARRAVAPAGPWPAWTPLDRPIRELAGKRWGIIGLGAIGRRVAGIASAFGCQVTWTSASGAERPEAWPRLPLEELLAASDIVSIHSPITEKSRGLLGAGQLAAMKPGSLLVNAGRGGIVDEAALAAALRRDDAASGRPGMAALDVLLPEPPEPGNPLFGVAADRIVITPHMAWAAIEARQRVVDECAANLADWLAGGRRCRVV
jgi:glycerate dehydrogenase